MQFMGGGFSSKEINLQSDKSQLPQANMTEMIALMMQFLDKKHAEEPVYGGRRRTSRVRNSVS
jgi:hypothetical protein